MNPLYLLGSGKPRGQSTSEALVRYLHRRLALFVDDLPPFEAFDAKTLLHPGQERKLVQALDRADFLVVASPIYIDALPYPLVHIFEQLALHTRPPGTPCQLVGIVNSGFPEAEQCQTALDIMRIFSEQAGFNWAGGLALGGGEALQGHPLEQAGGAARHARAALTFAAKALARGEAIPEHAVRLMATPFIPAFLYRLIGEWGWRRRAKKQGACAPLDARPFEDLEAAAAERSPRQG